MDLLHTSPIRDADRCERGLVNGGRDVRAELIDRTDHHVVKARAFAVVEHELLRGPYVLGATLSACDYYLLTIARWLEADGVDLARLPRVVDHRRRLLEQPLVQRVIAQEEGA